jgi:hypothetical protein
MMCAYYDLNHHFCCFAFVLEIIAPFDHLNWYLLKAKKQKTMLWKANEHILMYLFQMRTGIEFIIIYEMCVYHDETIKSPWCQLIMHISASIVFAFYLTPYWTYVVAKQFIDEHGGLDNIDTAGSEKED